MRFLNSYCRRSVHQRWGIVMYTVPSTIRRLSDWYCCISHFGDLYPSNASVHVIDDEIFQVIYVHIYKSIPFTCIRSFDWWLGLKRFAGIGYSCSSSLYTSIVWVHLIHDELASIALHYTTIPFDFTSSDEVSTVTVHVYQVSWWIEIMKIIVPIECTLFFGTASPSH